MLNVIMTIIALIFVLFGSLFFIKIMAKHCGVSTSTKSKNHKKS